VAAAEKRAQAAKQVIDETASRVDTVKASLDKLSQDVDTQTKRVTEKSGETSQKLQSLDSAISDSQKRVEQYQARSEELSHQLDAMNKSLDQQASRVTQVSKQVDNVSIRQVYPSLGQQKYITYNGAQWKGVAGKLPNEKWINIYIQGEGAGDYSVEQMEKLVAQLKSSNLTPLLGMFGVGGPYFENYGPIGGYGGTAVFYFKKDLEETASSVCAMVSETLSIKVVKPQFLNPADFRDDRRLVIEQSGLDLQLYIAPR
jgi:prefoldin subunit 5